MKYTTILSLLFVCNTFLTAQEMVLAVYPVKDAGRQLNESQKSNLTSKIQGWITETGVGSASPNAQLGFAPEVILNEPRTVSAGMRNLTTIDGELVLTARQRDGKQVFDVFRKRLSGSGTSTSLALSNMISNVSASDPKFSEFVVALKPKVLDFYQKNCSTLLAEAARNMDAGQMQQAMADLLYIPEQAPCRAEADAKLKANYARYRDFVCKQSLTNAKAASASKNYAEAVRQLRYIDPEASCASEANAFIEQLRGSADSDYKAQLDTVKEYFKSLANQQNWQVLMLRDYMSNR
ncbi:MAG: hypothetical protein IT269_06590 [Saprospiraceae bacterium]|nr:hypothetical protein [Saprospiraceae bacterium]